MNPDPIVNFEGVVDNFPFDFEGIDGGELGMLSDLNERCAVVHVVGCDLHGTLLCGQCREEVLLGVPRGRSGNTGSRQLLFL